jgi:hypothetical protein
MWYESVNFWFGIFFTLCVIGHYVVEGIDKYTENKYQGKSLFTLEKEERKK